MVLVVWSYLKVACVSETGKKGANLYFTSTALPSPSANQRERSGYDALQYGLDENTAKLLKKVAEDQTRV